jgi:5-methylcytosine-specific restriction endonuclease McrA
VKERRVRKPPTQEQRDRKLAHESARCAARTPEQVEWERLRNNAKTARYRARHPERVRDAAAKRRAEHPLDVKKSYAKWLAAHREQERARKRTLKNREKARERARRRRAEQPEHARAINTKSRKAHPEKTKARVAKWRAANHPISRMYDARRRAHKLSAPGVPYTAAEFRALCDASSWQCSYCPTVLDVVTVQADHVVPLSRGGSNGIENIAVSCKPCNASKKNLPLDIWLERRRKVA